MWNGGWCIHDVLPRSSSPHNFWPWLTDYDSVLPTWPWMHWVTHRRHSDLFWAATSASSQVIPILNKSLLTVLLQFVHGRPGPLLNPGSSQCNACQVYALVIHSYHNVQASGVFADWRHKIDSFLCIHKHFNVVYLSVVQAQLRSVIIIIVIAPTIISNAP